MPLRLFLGKKLNNTLSIKAIKRHIDTGACDVNGIQERHSSRPVLRGSTISLRIAEKHTHTEGHNTAFTKERIVYEDDFILAYNKPSGIAVQGPYSLENQLHKYYAGCHLVHRLDIHTSGLILFAKDEETFNLLKGLFRSHDIHKEYKA